MNRWKSILVIATMLGAANVTAGSEPVWVPAYLSSPAAPIVGLPPEVIPPPQAIQGTVRYKLTLWAEGERVALRFSNEAGTQPLHIGQVTVALQSTTTPKILNVTFSGAESVVIPAGAPALSDPVSVSVKPGSDILVNVFLPEPFAHTQADGIMHPTLYSKGINATASATLSNTQDVFVRPIVSAVLVLSKSSRRDVIVTLGDSITDGTGASSPDIRGWPDSLAARLWQDPSSTATAANAGISGNQVLVDDWGISALSRFDRDVLAFPSVKHVILLEGINDIIEGVNDIIAEAQGVNAPPAVSAEDIITGYRQLIARAHQHQIQLVCGTMLPFEGYTYFSEVKEQLRQQVNTWIRKSAECDAYIDFDEAMRDPANPRRLQEQYDSGDHIHPNDAGYRAMADFIDLRIFD